MTGHRKPLGYSVGSNLGFSPVNSCWITLSYNVPGFVGRDFDAAQYSVAGPYLKLRFKFDPRACIPDLGIKRQRTDCRGYSRLLAAVLLAYAGHASALSTTKTFTPDNIATNATSNLKIALTHLVALNNLTITDNFPTTPGYMTLANTTTTNSCNGTLTDSSGGSLAAGDTGIRLNNGSLTALLNPVCNFTANVTADAAGTYTNTTGTPSGATLALLPTSGTGASANLYVYDPPVLQKTFVADHIELNGDSIVTYRITNPATNPGTLSNISVTDSSYDTASTNIVARLTTVTTAVLSSGCGGSAAATVTQSTGTASITGISIAPGAVCDIRFHVTGVALGTYTTGFSLNSGTLTPSTGSKNAINFGTISSPASLLVVGPLLNISKSFTPSYGAGTDDNVQTNAATALAVTLQTLGSTSPITSYSISDVFPTSPGAMTLANNTASNNCNGTLTDSGGGSLAAGDVGIKLAGGSVAGGPASCTFSVNVKAATRGNYTNTTGSPGGTYVYYLPGQPTSGPGTSASATGNTASDILHVYDAPTFTKSFNASTIAAGATSVLTFTLTNPSGNPGTLSGVSFTDNLPGSPGQMRVAAIPAVTTPLPAGCGSGAAVTAAANATAISFSGGTLAPGASCTFSVTVTASAAGTYANSATLDNTGPGTTMSVNTGGGKINFTAVTAATNLVVTQSNPALSVAKTVSVLNDPINGGSNPKAIPGATMVYSITVSNTGPGSISADSTVITDPVPANLTLCTGNGSGSSGLTVAFIDGSGGNASGLTALAAGDISYSSTAGGGAPFTYAPAANTCDPAITGLRINPKGSMSGASGGNTPTFTLQFKTTVR